MEMEEDMEVEAEPVFEAHEIDLEYEFDAVRFFDFTREETHAEACEAELWFESAKSYPPSPFVAKLVLGEDVFLGNVNVSPKSDRENPSSSLYGGYHVGGDKEICANDVYNGDYEALQRGIFGNLQKVLNQPHGLSTGLYNHLSSSKPKGKTNARVKASCNRSSTLMKPTASQLAKQNRPAQVGSSRFQMLPLQNNEKSLCSSSGVENQAPKRQKLDGGQLRKVTDGKQQTTFVHKAPKKDEITDKNAVHAKLRLTIPREPELVTAHRAQRTRPRSGTEIDQATSTVRRFKARPFNKKIFEAPSLPLPKRSTPKLPEFHEFRLKTMDRAMQNASSNSVSNHCNESDKGHDKTSTSSVVENGRRDFRRPIATEVQKQDGEAMHRFKALPLNKKIFSSKGDLGIFRNNKRETTVPMEFNFHTEKRIQHNPPPTDLFSKLSLTSELQPNNGSQLKVPWSNFLSGKGSKENRFDSFKTEHKVAADPMTEKPSNFSRKQIPCGTDGCISDLGGKLQTRSFGIR
ncbi:protein TPX2-like isoform X2 [Humulus lupulus]|uniref:protein TPX2-like isoform X2 n=1 Tax=Humulus lupulus TaxID=3486 RepID=UPI002B403743|nr:protein TPX2-like isoform X2 [Humulus lupulus]